MADLVAEGVSICVFYGMTIKPTDVARVLNAAGITYVLAGAHAVNAHSGRPRATLDVDVLTESPKRAADALQAAYPDLTLHDTPVVTRLFRDGREAVDVMKAKQSKLFRQVVRLRQDVAIEGIEVSLPRIEAVLAMKFNSMIFLGRKPLDRQQDGIDFCRVIEAADALGHRIDTDLLRDLGDLVYAGGGEEILSHLESARAGKPLDL